MLTGVPAPAAAVVAALPTWRGAAASAASAAVAALAAASAASAAAAAAGAVAAAAAAAARLSTNTIASSEARVERVK